MTDTTNTNDVDLNDLFVPENDENDQAAMHAAAQSAPHVGTDTSPSPVALGSRAVNTATASLDDIDSDDSADQAPDGRGRLTFYMRPGAQGGKWMACEFIMKADGSGPEEVILRGRTNPRANLAEDKYGWNSTRAAQVSTWIKKKHETGYTNFGGPIESFHSMSYDSCRTAWRAACGETDPDIKGMLAAVIGPEDADTIASTIMDLGFTIDYTSAVFGQRVKGAELFARPSGEVYYARQLGDTTDVQFLRDARAAGMSVMFNSPPGVGKSALVEAAFPDAIALDGTGETEVSDFVGQFVPHESEAGRYDYVDGPLIESMLKGVPFFIDELSRINPQVLTIIYPLMDGRNRITAPGRPASLGGPHITAQPGFYIVAAYNPDIPGCRIDEPLLSRFAMHVAMSTCYRTAKILGVPDECVKASQAINDARMDPATDLDWAPQLRECIRFKATAETFGLPVAWQALVGAAPVHARHLIAEYVRTYAKASVPPLAVGAAIEA